MKLGTRSPSLPPLRDYVTTLRGAVQRWLIGRRVSLREPGPSVDEIAKQLHDTLPKSSFRNITV
jgi:hypothetical protein